MKEFTLYGGEVTGTFEPEARFRYKITDPVTGLDNQKVRGVTTVLGDILDKPGLRLWARDEMAKRIFGFSLDKDSEVSFDLTKSLWQPDTSYTVKEMSEIFDNSFDAYKEKSDRGKDIGTMTHAFVARYLEDGTEPTMKEILSIYPEAPAEFVSCVMKAVASFITWWSAIDDKEVLGTENVIYSRKYKFSGTYDLKCRINGRVYMLDVKTTNRSPYAPLGVYPEYFMQLGGYIQADEESGELPYDDCGVVNVGKDGKLSIVTASDIGLTVQECKNSFVYAIQIHNWLEKIKKLVSDSNFKSILAEPNKKVDDLGKQIETGLEKE